MWALPSQLVGEAKRNRLLGLAAETAFFTMLSLFPSLFIAAGLLSRLDVLVDADLAAQSRPEVTEALEATLASQATGTVQSVTDVFQGDYGGLLTFAAVVAVVTIAGAWAVVVAALNKTYATGERRSWLHRQLVGLGLGMMTVVLLVIALVVVVVGPFLGRDAEVAAFLGAGTFVADAWSILRLPLLLVGMTLWLVVVFHVAPSRRQPWRHSLPGAVATAIMWLLATAGFHLYLRFAGERNPVLGAFGGGAIVMTWVYLLSLALLLGGALNVVVDSKRS